MIVPEMLDRFLAGVSGQAMREGARYAQEARVGNFIGSSESVSSVVRGRSGDFEVALWAGEGGISHRCTCPSWRNPCKHQIAAALVLRQCLAQGADIRRARQPAAAGDDRLRRDQDIQARLGAPPDPEEARRRAIEERVVAARREKLHVKPEAPPFLGISSPSGFAYRVHLRGGPDGPHSCDCPDFEANRLHTCKHVERARTCLRSPRSALGPAARRAAMRARIYLHFGELVEPRLFGSPAGRGAAAVRAAFDDSGLPLRPLARGEEELRRRLEEFGAWVEPGALAWLDDRLQRRPVLPERKLTHLLPPLGLEPYPYQWAGAAFLASTGRALLADEMGLGKTVQAILAAAALRQAERPTRCVTIVCPASLRGGWQDEIRRWLGEEATLLEGRTTDRARVIASRPPWLITHYEQVLRDHARHRADPPDLLIVDEAQRAKGLRTRTARVLKAIGARYVFALTGTPLENRLEEAYAIAQLIDQRLLPPLWQIDRDHFVRDDKGRRVVLYRGLDALRSRLAPAFLRRRKEDVLLDLPERLRSTVMVPMHPAVESTYEDVLAQVARIAAKKVILPADLDRMMRLLVIARRCCNGPHMLGLDFDDRQVPKLQELQEALRDLCLGEGRKAVVFSEWTDMTDRVETLCSRLRLPAFHLHGGVPVRRRPALIRSFTGHEGPAVFVSTDAGGLGLNLQAADVVINLDLPWNPARLEQRIARVHRIGSKRPVQELLLVTKESIEERILRLHDTKRNVLANIWAKEGEDVIAAPGGSGAFREMVQALLRTRAPEPAAPKPTTPESTTPEATSPEFSTPEATIGGGPRLEAARDEGPTAAAPTIDAAALSAAVAAVAPTLPHDHRRSLATVFRALAAALEA
ncbi:MAG: DEAD/DEAH box helicase [Acidobacteria bacterium]|nr:DEAD/DEAH box helicase [Acidobacteriota bacterium]